MKSRLKSTLIMSLIFIAFFIILYTMDCFSDNHSESSTNAQTNGNYFNKNKYGTYEIKDDGKGYFTSKSGNFYMEIQYSFVEEGYVIGMKGNTKGWISIGFESSSSMKDAEIIIGYVRLGKGYLTHHFGTGLYSHKDIKKMGGVLLRRIVELLHAREENNSTIIQFVRKLKAEGKYYKSLERGKIVKLLYAIGTNDKLTKRHKERGYIKIKLP